MDIFIYNSAIKNLGQSSNRGAKETVLIQASFFFSQTLSPIVLSSDFCTGILLYCFRANIYKIWNLHRHLFKAESFCSEPL